MKPPFEALGLLPPFLSKFPEPRRLAVIKAMGKALRSIYHPDGPSPDIERFHEISNALSFLEEGKNEEEIRKFSTESEKAGFAKGANLALKHAEALNRAMRETLAGLQKDDYAEANYWGHDLYALHEPRDSSTFVFIRQAPGMTLVVNEEETLIQIEELNKKRMKIKKVYGQHKQNLDSIRGAAKDLPGLKREIAQRENEMLEIYPRLLGIIEKHGRMPKILAWPDTTREEILHKVRKMADRMATSTLKLTKEELQVWERAYELHHGLSSPLGRANQLEKSLRTSKEGVEAMKKTLEEADSRISGMEKRKLIIQLDSECCFDFKGKRLRAIGSSHLAPHINEGEKSSKGSLKPVFPRFEAGKTLMAYTQEGKTIKIGKIVSLSGHRRLPVVSAPEEGMGPSEIVSAGETKILNPFSALGLSPSLVGSLSEQDLRTVVKAISYAALKELHPDRGGRVSLYKEISGALALLRDDAKFSEWKQAYSDADIMLRGSTGASARTDSINADTARVKEKISLFHSYRRLISKIGQLGKEFFEILRKDLLPVAPANEDGSVYLHHCNGQEAVLSLDGTRKKFTLQMDGLDVSIVPELGGEKMLVIGSTELSREDMSDIINSGTRAYYGLDSVFKYAPPILRPGSDLVVLKGDKPAILGKIEKISLGIEKDKAGMLLAGLRTKTAAAPQPVELKRPERIKLK